MNFLTATGPKLGPRRPRNVPGSTAADQQNRFYDTGKLYYESLASLPCTWHTTLLDLDPWLIAIARSHVGLSPAQPPVPLLP